MHHLSRFGFTSILLPILVPSTASFQPCPLLGPRFPVPTSLIASPIIQEALEDLTSLLDETVLTSNSSNGPTSPNTTSFSISLFSADAASHDNNEPFFFQYHHTAPSLAKSTVGVHTVDANSIYRIGGLTQVFTVWTFLIEAGDSHWNMPVTAYLPELAQVTQELNAKQDPVNYVNWDDILVGELASHMAGIARGYGIDDLLNMDSDTLPSGLPPAENSRLPRCVQDPSCGREEFLAEFARTAPVFLPGTTPIYSNAAFQILSYVLEHIKGTSFETMLNRSILEPLNMTDSGLLPPSDSTKGVIPANETASGWSLSFGDGSPARSLYTTLSNLSTAGTAILSSTLLPHALTRRWFQPVTHTSNLVNLVGRPWEIYTDTIKITDRVINTFTKLGDIGLYSSYLGLTPDYNVGFAILAADEEKAPDLNAYADIIAGTMLPALEIAAREEAKAVYTGSYQTKNRTQNSSLTITIDDEKPGMSVASFNINGTDIRALLAELNTIGPSALDFRLYPTNLRSNSGFAEKVAFRAVFQDEHAFADAGTPTCITWMGVDRLKYAGVALDEFVFVLGEGGRAEAVEFRGLGAELERV